MQILKKYMVKHHHQTISSLKYDVYPSFWSRKWNMLCIFHKNTSM